MKSRSFLVSMTAVLAMSACGGASTGTGGNAFVLEPTDAETAGTGLPFADSDSAVLSEGLANGDSFQVRLVGYENIQGQTTVQPTLTTETVTFVDDGAGGTLAELTYRGETLLLPLAGGEALLDNGQIATVGPILTGNWAEATEIFAYTYFDDTPLVGGLNANAFSISGFETSPERVGELTGTATYLGLFDGYGGAVARVTDPTTGEVTETVLNELRILGDVEMSISFADALVDATLDGEVVADELVPFTAQLSDAPITGNSYVGALDVTCDGGFSCTSNSQMGGAFYGPNGEETFGLISFDVDAVDADGTELRFVSGAAFGASLPVE